MPYLYDDTCGPGKVFDTNITTGEPFCRDEKVAPPINDYYCGQFPGTVPYHVPGGAVKCIKANDVANTNQYVWWAVAGLAALLLLRK